MREKTVGSGLNEEQRMELESLPPIQQKVVAERMKKDRETKEILNKRSEILSPAEMFTKMMTEESEERVGRGS